MSFGFRDNPAASPIPQAQKWIYSNYSGFTCTLANSNTAMTVINIGTSMLKAGQVVTGAGIVNNPPTTISSITNGTTIVLSQNTTSSASGSGISVNFSGIPGLQGTQFGNYGFYGVPDPADTDVPGCPWAIPETQTLNAAATFIPAPGLGIVVLAQGTTSAPTVEFNLNPTPTWTTIFTGSISAATTSGFVYFDGTNVRINNAGSAACAFTIYRLRAFTSY